MPNPGTNVTTHLPAISVTVALRRTEACKGTSRPFTAMTSSNVRGQVVSFRHRGRTILSKHQTEVHGPAGSFACDHPGCTYRSPRRGNYTRHKRKVHRNEKPFACNYTGCSFRAKTSAKLTTHKNAVHLNIRDNRCHVCEKRFHSKSHLKNHMWTHEGDEHEMAKCDDCFVNLRSKSSRKPCPAAGKLFECDHQGCDYKSKWKGVLLSHQKQIHSFSCSHTGCSFRSKTNAHLTMHQRRVHLKIRTKRCHVCDKRFFWKAGLRAHMLSQHQTHDHDIAECDDCLAHLKKSGRRYTASRKRGGKTKHPSPRTGKSGRRENQGSIRKSNGNKMDTFQCDSRLNCSTITFHLCWHLF